MRLAEAGKGAFTALNAIALGKAEIPFLPKIGCTLAKSKLAYGCFRFALFLKICITKRSNLVDERQLIRKWKGSTFLNKE
ncbi:MAG: hypothetical protein CSA95_04015 [Bacteroidetes bacterium]|nr:MAG: hypothetical protein CSA95_04015 [Bacteroidota bacterium]